MTRLVVTLPDDKKAVSLIKDMAKALGGTAKTEPTPAKKPRTQLQQDFVDAYKEAKAYERGEIELPSIEEFLAKWKAEKQDAQNSTGNKVSAPSQATGA